MKYSTIMATASVLTMTTACSIHPLPDDVTQLDTAQIVRNVRCEAALEVEKIANDFIDKETEGTKYYGIKIRKIVENLDSILRILPNEISKKIEKYILNTVSYDFTFTIEESGNRSAAADFSAPFTNGRVNLSVNGGMDEIRKGKREFKVVETFGDLAKLDCLKNQYEHPGTNIVYPLVGSVGMDKVIQTYFDLGRDGVVKGTFQDTLTFTTTVGGGASGNVTLHPASSKFRLIGAKAAFGNGRTDIHQVAIAIQFPTIDDREFNRGILTDAKRVRIGELAKFKATYQNCVLRAEAREDRLGALRESAPEQFCARFAELTSKQ